MAYSKTEYKHGSWFIFGEYKDGHVDIQSEPEGKCVLSHVKRDEAEELIRRHQAMLDELDVRPDDSNNQAP